jgi:hypothetical protein
MFFCVLYLSRGYLSRTIQNHGFRLGMMFTTGARCRCTFLLSNRRRRRPVGALETDAVAVVLAGTALEALARGSAPISAELEAAAAASTAGVDVRCCVFYAPKPPSIHTSICLMYI